MFDLIRTLSRQGVMGLNKRNTRYVLRYNPRRLYPLVDDKLQTKRLALAAGIAVPELYGIIASQHDIRYFPKIIEGRRQFVVKPAHGSGGDGILVIVDNHKGRHRLANGSLIDGDTIDHHISSTISGQYSLGGMPDQAMIEYCVQFDPLFAAISHQGVPDIRVIVFLGYPIMSMVRLPTRMAGGKANLHQGAVGAGIDIATGHTLDGVWGNEVVNEHPDTGNPISQLAIPGWPTILELAARCYELSGLGYLGVDIVLDRDLGPLILELNARPGLNIQIANGCGLGNRLRQIENMDDPVAPVAERVAYSVEHFGATRATPQQAPETATA